MIYNVWGIESRFDAMYLIKCDKKFLIWDLIKINNDYFLIKWEKWQGKEIFWEITYIWNLFSQTTVFFQQFISSYWYSWYFKIFNLYIQDTRYIPKLVFPEVKRQKKIDLKGEYISKYANFDTYEWYLKIWDESINILHYDFFEKYVSWKWQNLFVFPDLWTLYNFSENVDFKHDILNVSWTSLYRMKTFLDIKNGKIKNVFTTHAWVFQDWKNLKSIFVFDPYKWYYKNQQNPRYYLPELAKQIKFFYNVDELNFVMV